MNNEIEKRKAVAPAQATESSILEPNTTTGTATASDTPHRVSPFVHFIWATAIVAIFAICALWLYPVKTASDGVEGGKKILYDVARESKDAIITGLQALAEAFKPSIKVQSIYTQTLGQLDHTRKLVVYTQEVDIEVYKEENKRVLNDWIPWGKANVRMKVMGNKVQFFVPMASLNEQSFSYDRRSRKLLVKVPRVELDKEMVMVQSDPDKMLLEKNGSWLPFGADVEKLNREAMSELKDKVILAANHQLIKEQAQRNAQLAVEQFFSIMSSALSDNVALQICLP